MPSHRVKKYRIDHEGMQRVSALGAINPEDGTRSQWQPDQYVDILQRYLDQPGFDVERYCSRCKAYDKARGILPDDLVLPPKPKRTIVHRPAYPWPWQPGRKQRPASILSTTRPGLPRSRDGCHMCLFSFLEPIEVPPISDEERRQWQELALRCRDDYYRLRRAAANPNNFPALAIYIEPRLEKAKVRLRAVIRACRERGFEPWRWGARREGDDAPAEVVSTEWRAEE